MDSNTPKYKDAVGYLLKLRDQKNKPWFSHVCDLAVSTKDDSLSESELNSLWACFSMKAAYKPTATLPKPPLYVSSALTTTRTLNTLQELSSFTNFKLLSDTLSLKFIKPVTIVFGTNGSGKSSLCEAIKVLANADQPTLPLENVRNPATAPTTFSYKFAQDSDVKHWKLSDGYGACTEQIKYFDSSIAIRHITGNADPELVVEIAPFRLEVFEYCGAFINTLQRKLETSISKHMQSISQQMELVKAKFIDVPETTVELINDFSVDNCGAFKQAVKTHIAFSKKDSMALDENKIALDRLNTASSEQGLKLLRSEVATLNAWKDAITEFCELAEKVSPTATKQSLAKLTEKKQLQKALAKEILPGNVEFGEFKTFLESAHPFFSYKPNLGDPCPFCRTSMESPAINLIKKYHKFLTNLLQDEIATIEPSINESLKSLQGVIDFDLRVFMAEQEVIESKVAERVLKIVSNAKDATPATIDELTSKDISNYMEYQSLNAINQNLIAEIGKRNAAINTATSDKETQNKEKNRLERIIGSLYFHRVFTENHKDLIKLVDQIEKYEQLKTLNDEAGFAGIKKSVTDMGKEAYKELVLSEFEKTVNGEYRALSGKNLADFGIRLKSEGVDQLVNVIPQIGYTSIHRVLSEGEQKVHALALFMSEALIGQFDVLVLDDPVTSFDYNYSNEFAKRLRDFVRDNPSKQVIVFTHNWDFFIHFQDKMNKSGLDNNLSVMVIENCSIAEEYKEDIDHLTDKIDTLLSLPGEPSREKKEKIAGYMRRLIETIINQCVFNKQRHQFKQKSTKLSAFRQFTKLVPLEASEADKLRDLFSDLSISEHDDPRNAYICKDKAAFRKWYNEIMNIEAALRSRVPSL